MNSKNSSIYDPIYYAANKERILAASKRWRERNPSKARESTDNWQKNNKERMKTTAKVYRNHHQKEHRENQAARKRRTPLWADRKKIKEFYKACPNGMVVDHIIPLKGSTVSGLHVHNNLQYLTPEENSEKSNKFNQELF